MRICEAESALQMVCVRRRARAGSGLMRDDKGAEVREKRGTIMWIIEVLRVHQRPEWNNGLSPFPLVYQRSVLGPPVV